MCARLYGSSGARTGQGQSYLCCASHPIPGCRRFLLYIYMGVSLARSYREDEAIPTWIHKKARTRLPPENSQALSTDGVLLLSFQILYPSVSRVQILGSPTHTRHVNSHKIGSPQQTPSWQRTPFQEGEACIITEQSLRRDFLKVLQKSFHQTSQSISPSTTRRPSLLIREAIKDPLLNALKPSKYP
ncbi:hypothetical protein DY000_02011045 [Brassica cretica]|uniref:Uncharacterized protein n=1 Tax=Brassica cretica TaxID=69181 RepID=A0ABQ7CQJ9_BRACR|nr:hypothetical protein DY000_02011045 [Brassica cretica]